MRSSWPALTIVMPVRDEGPFMARSLSAVLDQDYPGELTVVVADGMSVDETTAIVRERAATDQRLKLIANPQAIVPTGLNLALSAAEGSLVMRVDGHCEIPPGYARTCVDRLLTDRVDCVGGVLETVGSTSRARAIALAQTSPVGVGGAAFRTGSSEVRQVDTVAFGVYHRDRLRALGGFDEELVRNQDDELNLRLRQDGGTILLDPSVTVTYHSRATISRLARQYAQYGWFKPLVLRKRGSLPAGRSAVPALLVLLLVTASALAAAFGGIPAAAVPLACYLGAMVVIGLWLGRSDWRAAVFVPAALTSLHLPYGLGFLGGLWRWRRAPATPVRVDG